ncbi:MAG: hypothetical protein KGK03_04090 [Candidatus Omnitrophica bacterium]|nr:hypothetical protein [Candidatus Omnitrophota bacterium]MDE2222234.1 hypothetical protein [Candidatus Omnitrophota bacterium]
MKNILWTLKKGTVPVFAVFMVLLSLPVLAQEMQESDNLIAQMRTTLDLQPDQVAGITPIIQRYVVLFANLQKSIHEGTINPSAVDSQRQQLEAAETQELSQYLQPYQLSEWRQMQAQLYRPSGANAGRSGDDPGQYTNYPVQNPNSE